MIEIVDTPLVWGPLRIVSPIEGSWFDGTQAQRLTTILAGDQLSVLAVHMPRGHVTAPHVHQNSEVVVYMPRTCGPVLTLAGDRLEYRAWLSPGELLAIPPRMPHVAVAASVEETYPGPVRAYEVRATGDPQADFVLLPGMWPLVRRRIRELHLAIDPACLPTSADSE
jgi:uncharacterized RmlC-like cupin family protein